MFTVQADSIVRCLLSRPSTIADPKDSAATFAAGFLYPAELGCARRFDSKGYASYEPRDKTSVSTEHGRAGLRCDGKSKSAGVGRAPHGPLRRLHDTAVFSGETREMSFRN
jgi:hypothetical protein